MESNIALRRAKFIFLRWRLIYTALTRARAHHLVLLCLCESSFLLNSRSFQEITCRCLVLSGRAAGGDDVQGSFGQTFKTRRGTTLFMPLVLLLGNNREGVNRRIALRSFRRGDLLIRPGSHTNVISRGIWSIDLVSSHAPT